MKRFKNSQFDYVIIGNSVAGIAAIEAIRELDCAGKVAMVDMESRHVYSRPLISYYLEGKADDILMSYRPRDFYKRMKVKPLLGRRVERILPGRKSLRLDRGRKLSYGKLLIAAGAEPIIPSVKGVDAPNVYTFNSLADAKKIRKAVSRGKKALVMGAGLVGIKAAEGLAGLGARVTVVELAGRPLPAVLDEISGRIVAAHIRKNKVRLLLESRVAELRHESGKAAAALTDKGEEIKCDIVVIAVGMRPRLELCPEAGIATRKGILIDGSMRSTVKDIYAAGDVVETGTLLGGRENIQIWPLACTQGRVAGTNMAGGRMTCGPGVAMNSIQVFGLPVITFGDSSGVREGYEFVRSRDRAGPGYKKIVLLEGRIVGAIFVGDIERAGIISGLIMDRVDVGPFKDELLKESFGYIYVPKEYRARHISPMEV